MVITVKTETYIFFQIRDKGSLTVERVNVRVLSCVRVYVTSWLSPVS